MQFYNNYFNINNSLFSKIGFVVLSSFHIITSAQQNNSHNYDFDKSVQSCNENIGNIKNINDLFSNLELLDLKCFNKVSNFNPSLVEGYLNQENMLKIAQKAKELLETKDVTVSEAASLAGFNSPSNFTKVFSEKYGITPSQFQRTKPNATNE